MYSITSLQKYMNRSQSAVTIILLSLEWKTIELFLEQSLDLKADHGLDIFWGMNVIFHGFFFMYL